MSSFTETLDPLVTAAKRIFKEKFDGKREPECVAFAPGRCNLIGEHVDYTGGFVLPFAMPFKTVIVGSKSTRENGETQVYTSISAGEAYVDTTFKISDMRKESPEWANYIKGTITQYLPELPPNASIDMVIVSNVPLGAGLSSSAALEVAVATFLENLYNITTVTGVEKALRCQKAEHTWADTPCGIMDQYISAMGQDGNLLLIDCRSREYQLVPFGGGSGSAPVLMVTNSNVKHNLSGSEYPDRVRQCREAVATISAKYPQVKELRDATMEMVEEVKVDMSDVNYRRARHCVAENARTLDTVEKLKVGDFITVGKHMTASHISLRDDFEVSCPEVNELVDLALQVPGVLGSRMTGGGFGGCTVTLLQPTAVELFKDLVGKRYNDNVGIDCVFYLAVPAHGAQAVV